MRFLNMIVNATTRQQNSTNAHGQISWDAVRWILAQGGAREETCIQDGKSAEPYTIAHEWKPLTYQPFHITPVMAAGLCLFFMLVALLATVFTIWKIWAHSLSAPEFMRGLIPKHQHESSNAATSTAARTPEARARSPRVEHDNGDQSHWTWSHPPQTPHQKGLSQAMMWLWEVVVTISPVPFLVLALLALGIDGEVESAYGERLLQAARLSPTIYPIVFAMVAARFYKNVARWALEQPHGIRLATLEQIFGSQSFASAVERLLFLRAHVAVAFLILFTWTMSPLGGQSASRILHLGGGRMWSNGTVYYADPQEQFSQFYVSQMAKSAESNVYALYTTNLMQSAQRRNSPTDLWSFPKIPQWPLGLAPDQTHEIDSETLRGGEQDYSSLLGIKVQGLDFDDRGASYQFSVNTSYIDLACKPIDTLDLSADIDQYHHSIDMNAFNRTSMASFAVNITSTEPLERWDNSSGAPEHHMIFASSETQPRETTDGSELRLVHFFNCTMWTVYVETEIQCPEPSNCTAWRQRRRNSDKIQSQFSEWIQSHLGGLRNGISLWPRAAGDVDFFTASATENFVVGEEHLYAKQTRRNLSSVDASRFSRRLTTVFNTFWDASKGPLEYTNTIVTARTLHESNSPVRNPFDVHDFYRSTAAKVRPNRVYLADRVWIALLLATTTALQVLAFSGIFFLFLVRGPDILGFASCVTRDNAYIPLPPGGSSLDGPDRARALRHMRIRLADVRPMEEVGYIAVTTAPSPSRECRNMASVGKGRLCEGEQSLGRAERVAGSPKFWAESLEAQSIEICRKRQKLELKRLYQ
ncbi:hypothetical protein HJFPF1_08550 [Paramyrothecium foliicola]|nr:hypothetical protein HJFPF1_08550 [Paramyrothecium foliicola]